jgi:hypothetical protein
MTGARQRERRRKGDGSIWFDTTKRLWYGRWTRPDGSKAKTRGCDDAAEAEAALKSHLAAAQALSYRMTLRGEIQAKIDRLQRELDSLQRALQALDD